MKNYFRNTIPALLCTLAAMTPAMAGAANPADGKIDVQHLGVNNTLVRVNGPERFLLLPVQESNDDAKVNILVDGKLDRTIYVRMAKSKVDYTVPLDLEPYRGHDVVLDIVTTQNRATVREAKDDACWSNFSLTDSFDTANRDAYRPSFHHTPLYGWMNDPNGMFYKDGEWHLYYQWNPYGSKWQNMTWGHSSTPDLVNWTHHPVAIEPDGLGTVFSGSCAVDTKGTAGYGENEVIALFTSAGTSQMQSLAHSSDNGLTFTRYAGNPVLTLESEARDPNMFWNPETKEWNMVLAHALDHEMLFFTSPDLHTWTLTGNFGKGIGCQDGVWECPDLFPLPVDGNGETKWVLLCNINPGGPFGGSATQYFIGEFDGKTFKADTDASGTIPTKWMDYGKDHYATVTWSDAPQGRRTAIGWMSNWQYAAEVPTMQFRSANTLPRELKLFKGDDGQVYLASEPSPELTSLRGKLAVSAGKVDAGSKARTFNLPTANGGICEILADLDASRGASVVLSLSNSKGEHADIVFNGTDNTLSFDRRNAGLSDFSQDFPAVTTAPAFAKDRRTSVRIFVDRSSVEVFGDNGKAVLTNLVFPTEPYTTLSISATDGKGKVTDLKVYSLNPSK